MTAKPENPYAFPLAAYRDPVNGEWQNAPEFGMTLRDWLAGLAMQGMVAGEEAMSPEDIAQWAYSMANAMLVERKSWEGK